MSQHPDVPRLDDNLLAWFYFGYPRRRVVVIEQRRRSAEAFGSEQFFTVELAVLTTKLDVPLVGNLAELVVDHENLRLSEGPRSDVRSPTRIQVLPG